MFPQRPELTTTAHSRVPSNGGNVTLAADEGQSASYAPCVTRLVILLHWFSFHNNHCWQHRDGERTLRGAMTGKHCKTLPFEASVAGRPLRDDATRQGPFLMKHYSRFLPSVPTQSTSKLLHCISKQSLSSKGSLVTSQHTMLECSEVASQPLSRERQCETHLPHAAGAFHYAAAAS